MERGREEKPGTRVGRGGLWPEKKRCNKGINKKERGSKTIRKEKKGGGLEKKRALTRPGGKSHSEEKKGGEGEFVLESFKGVKDKLMAQIEATERMRKKGEGRKREKGGSSIGRVKVGEIGKHEFQHHSKTEGATRQRGKKT